MKDNTAGPAFPTSNGGSPDDGMTLRDFFAAKAMQGLIGMVYTDVDDDEHLALRAYDVADAMLKARQL